MGYPPEYWWKNRYMQFRNFLQDTDQSSYKNNNFDSWRDEILEMEITIDDVVLILLHLDLILPLIMT